MKEKATATTAKINKRQMDVARTGMTLPIFLTRLGV